MNKTTSLPALPKWPFFVSDLLLVGFALAIAFRGDGPLDAWQFFSCFLLVGLGAVLMAAPFVLEFRAQATLARLEGEQAAWAAAQQLQGALPALTQAVETLQKESRACQEASREMLSSEALESRFEGLEAQWERLSEVGPTLELMRPLLEKQATELAAVHGEVKALRLEGDRLRAQLEGFITDFDQEMEDEDLEGESLEASLDGIEAALKALRAEVAALRPPPPAEAPAKVLEKSPLAPATKPAPSAADKPSLMAKAIEASAAGSKTPAITRLIGRAEPPVAPQPPQKVSPPPVSPVEAIAAKIESKLAAKPPVVAEKSSAPTPAPVSAPAPVAPVPPAKELEAARAASAPPPSAPVDVPAPASREEKKEPLSPVASVPPPAPTPAAAPSSAVPPKAPTVASDSPAKAERPIVPPPAPVAEASPAVAEKPASLPEKLAPRRVAEDDEDEDAEEALDAPLLLKAASASVRDKALRRKAPAVNETWVDVNALIGLGNKPFLRGDGPGLSWDKGVPLAFVEIGKWRWIGTGAKLPFACRVYLNDITPAEGSEMTATPGRVLEIAPRFPS